MTDLEELAKRLKRMIMKGVDPFNVPEELREFARVFQSLKYNQVVWYEKLYTEGNHDVKGFIANVWKSINIRVIGIINGVY